MPLFFAMKHKRLLNALLATMAFFLVGFLSFMHPDWILMTGYITAGLGYFLVILLFTPLGKLPLGISLPKPSLAGWIAKLLLGQLALAILTLAAILAFFGGGPDFAKTEFTTAFVTEIIEKYTYNQWGIFPWGVYGVWGLIVAYVTYVKKAPPYLYPIAQDICPKRLEPMLKSFTDGGCTGATFMVLGLMVTAIILLLSYSAEKILGVSHFAVPFIFVTILSFFSYIFIFKGSRHFVRRLISRHKSLNQIYLLSILAMIPVIIATALVNHWFMESQPQLYQQSICHRCGNYFTNVPLEIRFAAIYWGWWLIWTPLAGSYLAKISQGRTIREFILGILIVPLLIAIAMITYKYTVKHPLEVNLTGLYSPLVLLLFALISWMILSQLIKGERTSQLFFSGVMPIPEDLKQNRLWLKQGSKITGLGKFESKLYMTVLGTLFLHTMAGWYGIQFQALAGGVFVYCVIYGAVDFFVIRLFKERARNGNRDLTL